ncbi:TPA: S8 family peptidase, partial [Photobacterium damselae]
GLEPDDDFYSAGSDRDKPLNGQVMLMLSDRRAIDELLSLWRNYGQDPDMQFMRGWAKFRDLFRLLKDIRYWDTQDRLRNTGILEYWQERLEFEPDVPVRFEAELWFRTNESKRNTASENVSRLTRELGGQVLSTCCLPDIHYQSLLLELPAGQVDRILNQDDVSLVRCDQVMLFRPLGQMSVEPLWNDGESTSTVEETEVSYDLTPAEFEREPRVALFDGLPLANHSDLRGSLIIDDPDNFESGYSAQYRIHGTAMASLIVNGDLTDGGSKLSTPLYVRPVMKPDPHTFNNAETLPDDELPLDIIHRAVRRIFEGDGTELPVAPSIKVINLSIGDPNIHFDGKMSPFARLLDWLSSKYNVLFVVSSGNHPKAVTVPQSGSTFHQFTDDVKAVEFFKAVQNDSWARKLLSPAESVNAVTVGSLHSDESSPVLRAGLYNIYSEEMPAAYSGQGNGYARSVKPDISMPGGRMLYNEAIGHSNLTAVSNYAAPGQQVAHPHASAFNHRVYIRGTSNSAALTSRGCAEVCDVLEGLFTESNKVGQFEQYSPLLLKSLITHGASWGAMYDRISNCLGNPDSKSLKNVITRNIGYGKPDV